MTRRLRIYDDAPEPSYVAGRDEGVPWCSLTCKHVDIRGNGRVMCHLSPGPTTVICIPAIREMAAELDELRLEQVIFEGRKKFLEGELARKVEPLSDADAAEFWRQLKAYTKAESGSTKWMVAFVERMQGRGGET